jgi:hypothetical protein
MKTFDCRGRCIYIEQISREINEVVVLPKDGFVERTMGTTTWMDL